MRVEGDSRRKHIRIMIIKGMDRAKVAKTVKIVVLYVVMYNYMQEAAEKGRDKAEA
jgi:hypothetical protein